MTYVTAGLLTGLLSGVLLGYVLQRGQLCLHATVRDALAGRHQLARGWALGVALGAVGFSLLLLLPGTDELNRGLAFRPLENVLGGLVMGVGMVVAHSCVSGLFFKLGAGITSIRTQLVDRYMADLHTDHALYIVAWFDQESWTATNDQTRKQAASRWNSRQDLESALETERAEQETLGRHISVAVLDFSLRRPGA